MNQGFKFMTRSIAITIGGESLSQQDMGHGLLVPAQFNGALGVSSGHRIVSLLKVGLRDIKFGTIRHSVDLQRAF